MKVSPSSPSSESVSPSYIAYRLNITTQLSWDCEYYLGGNEEWLADSSATSFIAFVAITLTATSFTDFIMSIVMTTKYKEVFGGWASSYPDVAVAGIVIGTLSMSYMVLYWLFSKRSFMSVRNVLAVTGFFALFNLGLSIAITVKRHDYCSIPEGTIPNSGKLVGLGSPGDCQGESLRLRVELR